MEPIYVGDLLPSIASYKKIFEKYDKGIKKENFMKNLSAEILITLIGKYDYYKKYFALADWIREWRKCRDKNYFIDKFVKLFSRNWRIINFLKVIKE